jgi:hypothetical protein
MCSLAVAWLGWRRAGGGARLAGFFRDRIMPQMMLILILGTPGN